MIEIELTESQRRADELIMQGHNILLLGKPGTGKTEFLRYIIEKYKANGKKVLATGSTGLAASNFAGGKTIHSVIKFWPGGKDYDYDECAEELFGIDLLIVDEVSTLDRQILWHLVKCLCKLEERPQIIFSGDFFQLPPVCSKCYPFQSRLWPGFHFKPCVLTEVVRQSDPEYIDMLEKAMYGDASCIDYFNSASSKTRINGAITICATNKRVEEINNEAIGNVAGKEVSFMTIGEVDRADFTRFKAKKTLVVKQGMRVMTLVNSCSGKYRNGSLGTIVKIGRAYIKVHMDNDNIVAFYRESYWLPNIDESEDDVIVKQFPLCPAYAITIHKSQGQTFDAVNIDAFGCWEAGQLYVALSRARDIKNVYLTAPITERNLKTDPRVIAYYESLRREMAA
ncbi:UvrD-like helicase C-terminal domain-containing protein [Lachnospiraceae bacterium YSD2013]|nr:UvrD-like helicase C-terminal domain-containing protein [Lachnospiraceae bacterium YSD2013]